MWRTYKGKQFSFKTHLKAEKEAKELQIQYNTAVSLKRMDALDIRDKLERTKVGIQPKEVIAKWTFPSSEPTSEQLAARIKERVGEEKVVL